MSNPMQQSAKCPSCSRLLQVEQGTAYCGDCKLYLARIPSRGRRVAGYALSLPERLSRIAVGSVAGILKGSTDLLIPDSIRQTRLYHFLLNKNLRYLIQELGDVEGVYPREGPGVSNYVARKFVGNFVDLMGILTLRASPVWILALVSDLSGGTKAFLQEFVKQLKREGHLDPNACFETLDQVLDGLQNFAGQVADRIDTPPLSVEELRETLTYLRNEAGALKLKQTIKTDEMNSMLRGMKEVAQKEKRSVFEISAVMAMSVINRLQRSGRSAVTGLRVSRALLDRSIFRYYAKALEDISRRGYYRHLARSSKPYLRAIAHHLTWKKITWTERFFLGHTWNRARSFN